MHIIELGPRAMASDYARYAPTQTALMRADLRSLRMAQLRKSSSVGAKIVGKKRALTGTGLGALPLTASWGDTLLNLGSQLVGARITEMSQERAAAEARLAAAEAQARMQASSDAAAARSIAAQQALQPAKKPLPLIPIALGVAGVGAAVWFMTRRKRGK